MIGQVMEHWAFAKSAATATNANARIQLEYMLNFILAYRPDR